MRRSAYQCSCENGVQHLRDAQVCYLEQAALGDQHVLQRSAEGKLSQTLCRCCRQVQPSPHMQA
jgi:hypothetical protein